MTTQETITGRISMREDAANLVEKLAGDQPCDCAEKDELGFWINSCSCRNYDDKGRISSWCTDMNTATTIRSIPEMQPIHDSECAQHNMPAYPNGPCDCSVSKPSPLPSTDRGAGV